MGLYSIMAKRLARHIVLRDRTQSAEAPARQRSLMARLVRRATNTRFGRDHDFAAIATYDDFRHHVPVCDYEGLAPYFNRTRRGEPHVLWPGRPLYLAKTSGTTSGVKYIPITRDSISNHTHGARNALLHYIDETGNVSFLEGKWIFLSGSPELDRVGGIKAGRLSGIVNHHVPSYLRNRQLPSYATNCIADWEQKLDAIVAETRGENMTLISGIPPWVQMYFGRLIGDTGRMVSELFPNLSVLVYGGVSFEPYRTALADLLGKTIDTVELYPASEGFLAYQDRRDKEGLRLCIDSGIFFEFIPADEYFTPNPARVSLEGVELGKNYALVINSNAGLWGYSIGDTVRFVSLHPHRVVVTGRIAHFTSAFGEHVIAEEVDGAMSQTLSEFPEAHVAEFTVAPQVAPLQGLPHHQWLIEFVTPPADIASFAIRLDERLCALNIYYRDLIQGGILSPIQITPMPRGAFVRFMKSEGKLGGQNKMPRLSNDRSIANRLLKFADPDFTP